MENSNLYAQPEFYYPYIGLFVILFAVVQIIIMCFYRVSDEESDEGFNLKFINNGKKLLPEENENVDFETLIKRGKELKVKYLTAFLFSKAGMWAKAPYTFILFSTFHKFSLQEIGTLYLVDAGFSLITSPFLGFIADTFGRKLVSFFYPFNTIIILILRMRGNRTLAYLGQTLSGISNGILATSFEAWFNYEVIKIYGDVDNQNCIQNYRKSIFTSLAFYDSVLSIAVTILGAFLFTFFGIFASLFLAIFVYAISCFIIFSQWAENKPNEDGCLRPFASIIEGLSLLRQPKILCVGIVDSSHMSAINVFNFIWTPILQITAKTKLIHPGMIFTSMLLSFLFQNKILELINKASKGKEDNLNNEECKPDRANVDYYQICTIFQIFFCIFFALIFFFNSWNTRIFCLIFIGVKIYIVNFLLLINILLPIGNWWNISSCHFIH